jgi:hypothetical protein
MSKFEVGCAYQIANANSNVNIFELTPSTNEPTTKLITKKLLIFKYYQVDSKVIKCPFQWWEKHEAMFSIIDFLTRQILRIVES